MSKVGTSENDPGEASLEIDVRDLGLDPAYYETDELEYAVTPRPLLLRNTLLERANGWVGHQFRGQTKEQCANFVRRLLAESGLTLPPAAVPFDSHLTSSLPQGPEFANSFFSASNGRLVGFGEMEPGDLLAFRDTYEGDFPAGCITHVGLYAGNNEMIDRSTAGEPIRRQPLDDWWKARFVVALRATELCS